MNDTAPPVGQPKAALDTPALLVDLDLVAANIGHVTDTHEAGSQRGGM